MSTVAVVKPRPALLALDVVAVLVFVVMGRRSHGIDGITGTITTAIPFLVGLVAGWLVTRAWNNPLALSTGLGTWAVTLIVGMVLRSLVFDAGVAPTFVVVTALFFAALFVGWRLLASALVRLGDH